MSVTWAFGPPIEMKDRRRRVHVILSGAKDLALLLKCRVRSKILRSAQDDMWWRSDLPNGFRRSAIEREAGATGGRGAGRADGRADRRAGHQRRRIPCRRFRGLAARRVVPVAKRRCGSVGRRTGPVHSWGTESVTGSIVTVMVQQIKLTRGLIAIFPDPSARARVADKGVSQKCVRFRAFFGVQNRTKLDKIVQKRPKRVQEPAENGGFSGPALLKRVKSCGSCQGLMADQSRPRSSRSLDVGVSPRLTSHTCNHPVIITC